MIYEKWLLLIFELYFSQFYYKDKSELIPALINLKIFKM